MSRFLAILATAAAMTLLIPACSGPAPNPAPQAANPPSGAKDTGTTRVIEPAPSPAPPVANLPGREKDQGATGVIDASEVIEKINVKLDIGPGADLEEPIALDLGLGYLLWLHPIGRQAAEAPPPGAIPQETTAKAKIAAGNSATFTFSTKGDAGQDKFRSSEHLLANTRVGDIARVGFASKGTTNWVLAGYDITINDKPFASGKPNMKAGERDTATKRLAELAGEIGPLEQVQNDMVQLLQANQLEEKDKAQLKDVQAKLLPLMREKSWLEGQLEGKYLWFEDKEYKAAAAGKPVVRSARVTLITFTHTAADTGNYVYVRIGGRKYFVSSPEQPLTGLAGPQIFDLDPLAGPLTEVDLRDWAVGMLANAKPNPNAADRWHGQRFVIEIDGQVVYDSDKSLRDSLSLSAIRLIPPAQLDKDGELVLNKADDLQVYLWEPAKGAGLDPATGTVLAPLPADNPLAPRPENPLAPSPPPEPPPPGVPPPPDLLPGEQPQPVINIINVVVNPPPFTPPTVIFVPLTPTPSGPPPQVTNVTLSAGYKVNDSFTVTWNVTGDQSQVSHYVIIAWGVDPANAVFPLNFLSPFPMGIVPQGGTFSVSIPPIGLAASATVPPFLVASVTAVLTNGSQNVDWSAVRMLFPTGTDIANQPRIAGEDTPYRTQGVGYRFGLWTTIVPFWTPSTPYITSLEGLITAASVWTHNTNFVLDYFGMVFEAPPYGLGLHLGVRPSLLPLSPPGDKIQARVYCMKPSSTQKLVAYLGFEDVGAVGSVTAKITNIEWFDWTDALLGTAKQGPLFVLPLAPTVASIIATPGTPTPRFHVTLDPADPTSIWFDDYLVITMEFSFTGINHSPVLFGVRLIP